jgi:uncharacterized membrane protein YphA (DoxX/SURF4 family)
MFGSAQCLNPLVPLILRLVLGAIFIYHGVRKVENDWGAAWARNLWDRQAKTPKDVEEKLDRMSGVPLEEIKEIKHKLNRVYVSGSEKLPAGLEVAAIQLAVAWVELLAGVALALGLLTRLSAVVMIVVQLGAIATVTWDRGFSFAEGGGYEYNVALLAMCVVLVLTGGGVFSMDACLSGGRKKPVASAPV